ncbi:MAG: host-nuclease inhibitor protein Gam [Acidiphilium sp. 37-60-79]|nr:MAG: host-nuclease inhibitor protein Gam [Acidiphilium sp. 37-60-79]OZB40902.1 MAG: host-nuclease inhibitor protein Gam [Acidiphilium sp. 34-60-192]
MVEAIAEIGRGQRELARIRAAMNDALAEIKASFELSAEPLARTLDVLREGVQIYCEAHRQELTLRGKTKTVLFASGEVKWRTTPPKVTIKGVEAVLDSLRRFGLGRFIRTREEISKEAILAEPEIVAQVPGLKIEQVEEFVIEPFEAELGGVS